jgi:phosphatidylinositol alpha-mannosyltransferase
VRIGIVSPYSLTLPGGVQGQILGLARALRSMGHDVRVLGPCDGPPPDAGVTPLGASLPTASNGSVAPIAPDISAQLRTIRALRDEDFDVVHLHEPLCPGPTQTALLFKTAPLVGTFHAAGSGLAYKWFKPAVRRAARRLDVRCAVSVEARLSAAEALGGTYEMVFNAVDTAEFAAGRAAPTEGPTVLFLGRHEPRKGLGVLLEAFDHMAPDTRLWVAGDGPDTAMLRARHTSDRIEWLGRISDADKVARLRGADVFCAPSLHGESFGIVLLEAMASGTPVVASDISGYAKVTRDGTDAVLVPPGDVAALAGALDLVIGDRDRSAALVASGTARVADFSMEALAAMYVGFYRDAIAG